MSKNKKNETKNGRVTPQKNKLLTSFNPICQVLHCFQEFVWPIGCEKELLITGHKIFESIFCLKKHVDFGWDGFLLLLYFFWLCFELQMSHIFIWQLLGTQKHPEVRKKIRLQKASM